MRDRSDMMPLVVREISRETPTIVSVRLEAPDAAPLPAWEPGAHIDLQLITRHERQYSLCGDPADTRGYRIAVLDEPLSRGGSRYIHSFLRVGSRVWVRPPRNLFALAPASRYLLLAAGIGITPILSMARRLAAEGADWRLLYLVRSAGDAAFSAELAALGDRVEIHSSGASGRLDLGAELSRVAAGTDVYACGPSGLTDALITLRGALPDGSRLHLERFEPVIRTHGPDEPFTVVCAGSDRVIGVPADRTMLQALNDEGIAVPGSCLRGVCGSCALRVLGGVPDHRDSLTTDAGATVMYPCVSRASTPELVVDA